MFCALLCNIRHISGDFNASIIFETTSDFHKQNIERKKERLEYLLGEYFKGKVSVQFHLLADKETLKQTSEPVQPYSAVRNSPTTKSQDNHKDFKSETSITEQKVKSVDIERHPIDQKIIELFDARESL